MIKNKKDVKKVSMYLMKGALLATVMAAVGYLGYDIWLASTQWLLVAAVMALFGVYMKLG
ncbi:hypothetical protein ISR94_01975 [Candidatus Microgenomates bacterium]|nr:hypothetical protein [Candidatus Microgenomates bacterium]